MCGVNVIFNHSGISTSTVDTVSAMNHGMIYRGPDGSAIWSDDSIVMGHCRLSIIGIDNGEQPLFNEDKSISLVCNGEIYNFEELRKELIGKGHVFNSESDSEVIIHLYEEYGLSFFDKLRGFFAFCLWDSSSKRLIVCRDRVGKKPLYYAHSAEGVVFSSEVRAITKHVLKVASFNNKVIRNTLKYSHSLSVEETHINEVKKVKPGEYLILDGDSLSTHSYWNINSIKTIKSDFENVKKRTLDLLTESVDLRLKSDVPVAILLSSGIDSTAVAALAKQCRNEVHAITIGYKGAHESDETEMAGRFAKDFGLTWHKVELDENDYQTYYNEYTEVIDEPVCDIAAIAQWGIYKKAKELGFKVLLSGIGGDELFYGYGPHNNYADNWDKVVKMKDYFPMGSFKGALAFSNYIYRNRKSINAFQSEKSKNHFNRHFLEAYDKMDYKWQDIFQNEDEAELTKYFDLKGNGIEKVYSYLYNCWLPNNCFFQTDKLGMGNSIEVRAPFADHVLTEYIASLPLRLKYNPSDPKWLLKESMSSVLPSYILNNPKKGFTPPMQFIDSITNRYKSDYFNTELHNYNQVLMDTVLNKYKMEGVIR